MMAVRKTKPEKNPEPVKKPIKGRENGQDFGRKALNVREEIINKAAKSEKKEERMRAVKQLEGDTEGLIEVIEKKGYIDSAKEAALAIPEEERRGKYRKRYEKAISEFHKRYFADFSRKTSKGL